MREEIEERNVLEELGPRTVEYFDFLRGRKYYRARNARNALIANPEVRKIYDRNIRILGLVHVIEFCLAAFAAYEVSKILS